MTDADKKLYDKAVEDLWSIAIGTPEEIDAMTTPWIAGYRKGIDELEKEKCELLGIIQGKDKVIADLQKENAELKSIADFQTSSNMDRYFQLKRSKEQLAKAKEIIKKLEALYLSPVVTKDDVKRQDSIIAEAEQFLNSKE